MRIRDRIKELRRVPAKALLPNPKNWRSHPPAQQDALRGLLAELGYCDAVLARELADGALQLIDGHLRCETTPDAEVPVLVLDVTEDEADKLLATLDPLASLAEADREALTSLLASVETDSAAVQALLADLAAGELTPFVDSGAATGLTDPDNIPGPPHQWRPGGITRIAFVAPKLDQVYPPDRDNMVALLKLMLQKRVKDHNNLVPLYKNCSAAYSTDALSTKVGEDGERFLWGVPLNDAAGKTLPRGDKQKFRVSPLPAEWPRHWEAGTYSFPEVHPPIPTRNDCPPDQVNLDNVFDFLI